jgi:hypothetical protein
VFTDRFGDFKPPEHNLLGALVTETVVEPVTDSRSRLTISVDFTAHGIGKALVPLMVRREARTQMPENIAALKRLIEEG